MVRTTPPKEDMMDTSPMEAPTTQALVARPESKAPDDNLVDEDLDHLNFDVAESEIACRTNSRLQRCWPDSKKLNYPIWHSRWSNFRDP
jgi:hypothetical protein